MYEHMKRNGIVERWLNGEITTWAFLKLYINPRNESHIIGYDDTEPTYRNVDI